MHMRVFAVSGVHRTGKTTAVEHIAAEMVRRGYTVGTIKNIHKDDFSIDRPGSNTARHRTSGASVVAAIAPRETDIMIYEKLPVHEVLRFYHTDWVIIEGGHEWPVPRIICARTEPDIIERLDAQTFMVCGEVADSMVSYNGIPVIDAARRVKEVVDMAELRVPVYQAESAVGPGSWAGAVGDEALGAQPGVVSYGALVSIDGHDLTLAPFVQDFVARTVLGMLSSLKGYEPGREVKIEITRA